MVGVITFILVHEKEGGKFLKFIHDIFFFYDKSVLFSICFTVNIALILTIKYYLGIFRLILKQ